MLYKHVIQIQLVEQIELLGNMHIKGETETRDYLNLHSLMYLKYTTNKSVEDLKAFCGGKDNSLS